MKLKLNPLPDTIRGKRLIVVDDSIVRGTTTRQIVAMLREAGAAEVHIRITSPPIRWPCFYGIDMSTRNELVAADLTVEEIRTYVGADSSATSPSGGSSSRPVSQPEDFCRACFDGEYPIPVPEHAGKFLLEDQLQLPRRERRLPRRGGRHRGRGQGGGADRRPGVRHDDSRRRRPGRGFAGLYRIDGTGRSLRPPTASERRWRSPG